MEIRARFILIGAFVLAAIVAFFGFIYWLSNSGGLGPRTAYRVEFNGPISGLWKGSDVLFNGLTVGEVTAMDLMPADPRQVVVTIDVDSRTPVRTDTGVGLVFSGLTGTAAVAMTGGAADAAPLPPSADGKPPLLVADPDAGKDLTQSARDALAKVDKLLGDNSAAVTDAIANIDTFAAALGRNSGKVDGIIEGLEKLTGGARVDARVSYDLAPPSFENPPPLPATQLSLSEATAVVALDTQRIMFSEAGALFPAYPDARWADSIPSLIRARAIGGFQAAGYPRVGADSGAISADFKLSIDVRAFSVDISATPQKAEVTLAAQLFDASGKVVAANIFHATAPISRTDDAANAAKGLDEAFGQTAKDLILWTLAAMQSQPAAAPEASPPTPTP